MIAPLDFIPDLTPVLGYSDDFVAITYALLQVQGYVDAEVKEKELGQYMINLVNSML